jgi:hypothetical protein
MTCCAGDRSAVGLIILCMSIRILQVGLYIWEGLKGKGKKKKTTRAALCFFFLAIGMPHDTDVQRPATYLCGSLAGCAGGGGEGFLCWRQVWPPQRSPYWWLHQYTRKTMWPSRMAECTISLGAPISPLLADTLLCLPR